MLCMLLYLRPLVLARAHSHLLMVVHRVFPWLGPLLHHLPCRLHQLMTTSLSWLQRRLHRRQCLQPQKLGPWQSVPCRRQHQGERRWGQLRQRLQPVFRCGRL